MMVSKRTKRTKKRPCMKSDREIMEILAAYDLTGSLRAAAEFTGRSHHTDAKHVTAGMPAGRSANPRPGAS